jgi:adenine-specific DNA-methyltransferase
MSKYDDLVRKLKEIFQIDRPELDFGVYRILNARAHEVNDYLENGLKSKVTQSLAESGAGNLEALQKELAEKEAQYRADGLDPDNVPKVKEIKQRISELGAGGAEHENAVFTHLLTFFSRYYDKGDFISQRRFKGDTYAIPYAGEEVVLHWANKEQYYTKSGEYFANYGFKLDDGRSIQFKLVAADTAKDNRKDGDKDRLFALVEEETRSFIDEEGDESIVELKPIQEINGQLVINFDYRAMPKGTKQETLIADAVSKVLASPVVRERWVELGKREPTEKNPQRTLLEKCLVNYTGKNSADYFIHRDLKSFLVRELDFYIKSEVMKLDDIQSVDGISEIERSLRRVQTLRVIAEDLIDFLSQLEEFQKKLWLKKKFVVATEYLLTLDKVPEGLLQEVRANPKQWQRWYDLGMRDKPEIGSLTEMMSTPFLMVDTSLYPNNFKYQLLNHISDLDSEIDGVLIHSDNYQAIRFLDKRYEGKIDCVYVDPPYNTGPTEIIYKNYYKNSSWLTMMSDRLIESQKLLAQEACYAVAIDDFEMPRLCELVDEVFPLHERQMVIVNHHPQGGMSNNISRTHEYMLMMVPQGKDILRGGKKSGEIEYRSFQLSGPGKNKSREGRPNSFYAVLVDEFNNKIAGLEPPPALGASYPTDKTSEGYIRRYPLSPTGEEKVWCRSYESALDGIARNEIVLSDGGSLKLAVDTTNKRFSLMSNWTDSRFNAGPHGTALVANMMGDREAFSYPKSIHTVRDSVEAMTWHLRDPLVMDFFGGSGTTGHAVINLNREDKNKRKYLLVEMGQYFDDVTKPRIVKAVYSDTWADGKATNPSSGVSQCIKVIRLEGYEDTLNNIHIRRSEAQKSLLQSMSKESQEDYLLRYMLNVESRGSLLSVANFQMPFNFKLKVAVDSAGAYEERTIDLVETFNYLIGLTVKTIDNQQEYGFVTVSGVLPSGEKSLVVWRDMSKIDYERLNRLCEKLAINPSDSEFDVVYINGDHNIPTVFTSTEDEGLTTKKLKIRQIEPDFMSSMFVES